MTSESRQRSDIAPGGKLGPCDTGADSVPVDVQLIATKLSAAWSAVLRVDSISLRDNFFGLGGDSMAILLVQRRIIDEFGVELRPQLLLETPILEDLVAVVQKALPPDGAREEESVTGVV